MSNKVLALKYRPQTFEDVVGQETTVRILKNLLTGDHHHPASLFTGSRGIGKTSLARIFAKALNCANGPTPTPCGTCNSCMEITEGRSLSVIEIDGASNTSVDDVRDLREKVRYLPPGGRYKIYIIDEVHMLSNAAFNALLKTLEEPPAHALFIFATTEPQKVPVTVISRCLRFDLRPITIGLIVDRLRKIAGQESIQVEEGALYEIARQALGGLRDALGLLDQIASFCEGEVTLQGVEQVLGGSPRRFLREILSAILSGDAPALLKTLDRMSQSGIDPKRFVVELLETVRHLLVVRVSQEPSLFDLPADEIRSLQEIAAMASERRLDQIFQMLQKGIPDLLRSPSPRILLDVLLLRLAHSAEMESIETLLQRLEEISGKGPTTLPAPRPPVSGVEPKKEKQPQHGKSWNDFIKHLSVKKPQLSSILEHSLSAVIGKESILVTFPRSSIHLEMLKDRDRVAQLEGLIVDFWCQPMKFQLQEGEAKEEPGMRSSDLIDEAVSIFNPRSTRTVPSP
ncbi:MAG: DNA polymerase III subunit gamma/tau [Deltaproteobacteria bacterium]|nr:DNA polymerase III subunit gamma/tau [Deltaproteobacteria bacterium]